jgi:glycosyltransferase involved in cell wall biosynthesis
MDPGGYIIITPARNEAKHLQATIASVLSQTLRPRKWIIVNDGSTDETGRYIDVAAEEHSWIKAVHRPDRGFRQPGTGVIEAFYDGLAHLGSTPWDYLVKSDADLAFAPDYFEQCLERFGQDDSLGIGGGLVCRQQGDTLVVESEGDPTFHVRGATKIYRRACWEEIGGLIKAPGWDTVDELKANMLGWKTYTFEKLKIHQLKDTGSADGSWRNAVKNGLANYVTGYHPLFMVAKCAKRLFSRPYALGAGALAWGFFSGYLRGVQRVEDDELIHYLRNQQIRRLTLRSSIWS